MNVELIDVFRSVRQSAVQFWAKYLACLDNKSCNPAWQTGHVLAGFLFPFVGGSIGGLYAAKNAGSGHQVLACVLSFAALTTFIGDVCWVLPKEFLWDVKIEKATISGGLDDALHYWLATAVAWGILLLTIWILGVS